jgi:hypothetical protein
MRMAWGKTEEEKQAERDAKARDAAAQQEALAQRQAAAQKAAEDAAFAASPVGIATAALAAGNEFLQIELEVSELTGPSSFFGSSSNQVRHTGTATDLLGRIEAVGWHLEHVGYVFIETGSTSTNRVLGSGEGVVTRGNVTGIYLFRRVAR